MESRLSTDPQQLIPPTLLYPDPHANHPQGCIFPSCLFWHRERWVSVFSLGGGKVREWIVWRWPSNATFTVLNPQLVTTWTNTRSIAFVGFMMDFFVLLDVNHFLFCKSQTGSSFLYFCPLNKAVKSRQLWRNLIKIGKSTCIYSYFYYVSEKWEAHTCLIYYKILRM